MAFESFQEYNKEQVILTSDRIIFNSKADSIFVTSNKFIGLSSNEGIHFNVGPKGSTDASKLFIVNAPKIQLGLSSKGSSLESVGKGDTIVEIFGDIINALNTFSSSLEKATGTGVGTISLLAVNVAAGLLKGRLVNATNKLEKIKSTVSYTI